MSALEMCPAHRSILIPSPCFRTLDEYFSVELRDVPCPAVVRLRGKSGHGVRLDDDQKKMKCLEALLGPPSRTTTRSCGACR